VGWLSVKIKPRKAAPKPWILDRDTSDYPQPERETCPPVVKGNPASFQMGRNMAKESKPVEVLNTQTKQAIENTTEKMKQTGQEAKAQALKAIDTYFEFLSRAISSFPSGGTDFGEKLKTSSEKNVAATHQFMRQVGQAKDFEGVFRLQTEFAQNQIRTFGEQASALAEAFAKTATSEVKTPFKSSLG
jgi:hypothetical protein